MAQTDFRNHKFTKDEKTWLDHYAKNPGEDPKAAKAKLWKKLSPGFDPNQLDSRFWLGNRLSALATWFVDSDHQLLKDLPIVIKTVRDAIVAQPGVEQFTAQQIGELAEIPSQRVGAALAVLPALGRFFSSGGGSGDGTMTSITLQGDDAYDDYLQFKDIETLFNRRYASGDVRIRQPATPTLSPFYGGEGWAPQQTNTQTQPIRPNTAFVLMAIDPANSLLEDVYTVIEETCAEFGLSANRADKIEHQDSITDRILEEIRTSEYLIADLSNERPNVYYEIGYAHAIGKRPVLYRRTGTRLHFDLSVHNAPEYRNLTDLRMQLRKRFEALLGREAKTVRSAPKRSANAAGGKRSKG